MSYTMRIHLCQFITIKKKKKLSLYFKFKYKEGPNTRDFKG